MKTNKSFGQFVAYQVIRKVHDGSAMKKRVNPTKVLTNLGLKEGDTVFEPGCGPGFYTLAAAAIVKTNGFVNAYDVNPYMIECIKEKMQNQGIRNINAYLQNANATDLENNTVDFSFIFGVPRIDGGMEKLIAEIARVSKKGALLAFQAERREPENLFRVMEEKGFTFLKREQKYVIFAKQ
jgi:ubiquinone/menaquinone biosynthesis C-methylase UbiE